jgi:hypothetical protein
MSTDRSTIILQNLTPLVVFKHEVRVKFPGK